MAYKVVDASEIEGAHGASSGDFVSRWASRPSA
jgi:hypothetical protein